MLKLDMSVIALTKKNSENTVIEAVKILKAGGIIAYPTESFYALGAMAMNEKAVKKIFDLKDRPYGKPLPLIVDDMHTLLIVANEIPDQAVELIKKFWPGPLTMIFEARKEVPLLITGESRNVAVRVPGKSVAFQIAKAIKMPVTATSANLSSLPPAINTDAVLSYFGDKIDLILNGGQAPGGKPSTILDVTVTPPVILREGSIELDLFIADS
jgi:L-threonylcarbamoyladenylate synthase